MISRKELMIAVINYLADISSKLINHYYEMVFSDNYDISIYYNFTLEIAELFSEIDNVKITNDGQILIELSPILDDNHINIKIYLT